MDNQLRVISEASSATSCKYTVPAQDAHSKKRSFTFNPADFRGIEVKSLIIRLGESAQKNSDFGKGPRYHMITV
ncbi:MAG: hypothetical protein DRQ56_07540 [Gammaproteobacteria bacterium]|nr:MAG: hypothetical protein DRQ56_07540 [Gammaproteobacteria bacterium]